MSMYTSTSEFDIDRRVQITNETPVLNLFEALNSTMQNDFYEWIIGTEEVSYNVPYSIKQENENGEFEDNSGAGYVGRFDIIRSSVDEDGAENLNELERNQVYFKSMNGYVSPIYGPRVDETLDGPKTFYHSKKISGVILPEYDFLLHHFYRYLECLYPDHPDWRILLTPTEMNDAFRACGKLIDYSPNNPFFDKVAKSLSKTLSDDEIESEATMIKIHNLRDEAYRRKFYGTYAGYKMLGNDIFQHISVFPVATYLPIKPFSNSENYKLDESHTLKYYEGLFNENFKTEEDFKKYVNTRLRKIDTFSKRYSNKFKLIDYEPKSSGNFAGYSTFKYFTTLWNNGVFEYNLNGNPVIKPENISKTSLLKDSASVSFSINSYNEENVYEFNGTDVVESDKIYSLSTDTFEKTPIKFYVYDLINEFTEEVMIMNHSKFLKMGAQPDLVSQSLVNELFSDFERNVKNTYLNPKIKDTLYLDPESTINVYKNDKIYNMPTLNQDSIYKIYRTTEKNSVNALLMYNYTPGTFGIDCNQLVLCNSSNLGTGIFSVSINNKNNEELLFLVRGRFEYTQESGLNYRIGNSSFRISSIPSEVTGKLLATYKNTQSGVIENKYRFYDSETGEILIDKNCSIKKICKLDLKGASEVEYDGEFEIRDIPFTYENISINDLNFGWGNFIDLFENSIFKPSSEIYTSTPRTIDGDKLFYPIQKSDFNTEGLIFENSAYNNLYLYSKSEFNENIKEYINNNFEDIRLYSSDVQDQIIIEGVTNTSISGAKNLISFESEIAKERIKTLSIGDKVFGGCIDNDDEDVFITEIGEDYIRVSNSLITSGTFDFKFNLKMSCVKIETEKPFDYINRLKAESEYEFYNPFEHGIYGSLNKSKYASAAYVNGLSNINEWKPIGKFSKVFNTLYPSEDGIYKLPSTIKFMNDLFVEYNADKILYYPTRNGKESCLMSVDWLDYLEERVDEASRLSDKVNVGVCISLQTDTSGNDTEDTKINSKFKVLPNVWNLSNNVPLYARVGNGSKAFKAVTYKSDVSGIGKSVYGKSVYSQETSEIPYKKIEYDDGIDKVVINKTVPLKMDFYGDNENLSYSLTSIDNKYKDIDNSIFEVYFGENDIISDYNGYTLAQVNIYKQSFNNLLKYSSYKCELETKENSLKNNHLVVKDDERWLKVLNSDETNRQIFKTIEQSSILGNSIISLPLYSGVWVPATEIKEYKDENGNLIKTYYDWSYPDSNISEGSIKYWLIENGIEAEIGVDSEKVIISDSAALFAYLDSDGNIVWEIKDFKYCNNYGVVTGNCRAQKILDYVSQDVGEIIQELGKSKDRIFARDIFTQIVLMSLKIIENEDYIKEMTFNFPKFENFEIGNASKIDLYFIKKYNEIKNATNKKAKCYSLILRDMGISEVNGIDDISKENFTSVEEAILKNELNYDKDIDNFVITNAESLFDTFNRYILITKPSYPLGVDSIILLDLKSTIETVTNQLYNDQEKPEDEEDRPVNENYQSTTFSNFEWDIKSLIEDNILLFTTKYKSLINDKFSELIGEKDIICLITFKNNSFGLFTLNKNDTFIAEIPVERFDPVGVTDIEWKYITDKDYCSIGLSDSANSTFQLPRKYLNDDYSFDITINPQFIGKGYEYKKDDSIDMYDDNGAEDISKLKNIEISKGAIYYDSENDEFYTWTYEIAENSDSNESPETAYKDEIEVIHKSDEIKKYAIKFEENKYFKNVLYSAGEYSINEQIDENNNTSQYALIRATNDLDLNIDKISSNDKIIGVQEISLRPIYSKANESKFLSNKLNISARLSGFGTEDDKNFLYFEPHKIKERAELGKAIEKLIPCTLSNDGKVTQLDVVDADGTINFNESGLPSITNSKYERPPILMNDKAGAEGGPIFKYFKNNLIFIGKVDERNPNIISMPDGNGSENWNSVLNNLSANDSLVDYSIMDASGTTGVKELIKQYKLNVSSNLTDVSVYYNKTLKEFIGFKLRNRKISVYTQQYEDENIISFNLAKEVIITNGIFIDSSATLQSVNYSSELSCYLLTILTGGVTIIFQITQTGEDFFCKKLFSSNKYREPLNENEYIMVFTDEWRNKNANSDFKFEIINTNDIKDTLFGNELKNIEDDDILVDKYGNQGFSKYIEYFDSYNNPTGPWEDIDSGENSIFISETGNSIIKSIYIKDTDLFIYSPINSYNIDKSLKSTKTGNNYWHHIDLSESFEDSSAFMGYTEQEIFDYTYELLSTTKEYSANDTKKLLFGNADSNLSIISNIVDKFSELCGSSEDSSAKMSTFNSAIGSSKFTEIFNIWKTEDGYTNNANYASKEEISATGFKNILKTLCAMFGAPEYIKPFVAGKIIDAFVRGGYLFIKDSTGRLTYISLSNLISFSNYSSIDNWMSFNLNSSSYTYNEIEPTDDSFYFHYSDGTTQEIKIPALRTKSILNIEDVSVLGNSAYIYGYILSKNEIGSLDETNAIIDKDILKTKNEATDDGHIYPFILKGALDSGIATFLKLDNNTKFGFNKKIKSAKSFNDSDILYFFESAPDNTRIADENCWKLDITNSSFAANTDFGKSDIKYTAADYKKITDDTYIGRNSVYRIENLGGMLSTLAISNTRIKKFENNKIYLDRDLCEQGKGKLTAQFAINCAKNIQNSTECLPGDTEVLVSKVSSVSSYHKANLIYSYNRIAESEDAHYYPYEEHNSKYYENENLTNTYGAEITYCNDAGIPLSGAEPAKKPKYFNLEDINKEISLRIEIPEMPEAKNISFIKYSSNPIIKIELSEDVDLTPLYGYTINSVQEGNDYCSREYDSVSALGWPLNEDNTTLKVDEEFSINNSKFMFIQNDDEVLLKNKDNNYYVLDTEFYLSLELEIPYLFNTKTGSDIIDTNFEEVKDTLCTGIYIPKNGYGSTRNNTDDWIYNKPWDLDADVFENEILKNKENNPIYLVDKNGRKIISNNGFDFYQKSTGNIISNITRDSFGENSLRTIKIFDNTLSELASVDLTLTQKTEASIYFPFIDRMFNGFKFKIMKDGFNILNDSNLSSLNVTQIFDEENSTKLSFTYNNEILNLTNLQNSNNFKLKFEFEDVSYTTDILNYNSSDSGLTEAIKNKINAIADKEIYYYYNNGKNENKKYECLNKDTLFNIDASTQINNSKIIYLSSTNNKFYIKNEILSKIEKDTLNFDEYEILLNISYITNIEIHKCKNEISVLIDDTLKSFSEISKFNILYEENSYNIINKKAVINESNYILCNKICSNGSYFKYGEDNLKNGVYISGLTDSYIQMKKPKYPTLYEMITREEPEIISSMPIYFDKYYNSSTLISAIGNNAYSLNKLIEGNTNIKNNLNDGKSHYIRFKMLTAQSITPTTKILSEEFEIGENKLSLNDYKSSFVELKNSDLINWPADRVYFNPNGIGLPPIKIGKKIFRSENKKDYNSETFKNNNSSSIFECDEQGNYITYSTSLEADKYILKTDKCRTLVNLFNPNAPKFELNKNYFKNNFYLEGNEANPFWQVIKIRKDFDEKSGKLSESSSIMEYKKFSNKVSLYDAENPYIVIKKTSNYETREELIFLIKGVDFINKKEGKLKFNSSIGSYDYYSSTEEIIKYGIKAENTIKRKLNNDSGFIMLPTYEKCNFTINSTGSNKINNDDSIIEISELGLFDPNGELMAYATFPPIEYRSDSQHLSFLLYIYNGTY